MSCPPALRVAIIGGGIGGLTLALALSRTEQHQSIEIDVFEASAEMSQIGAGITVSPRTWQTLKNLGLEPSLTSYLPRSPDNTPSLVFHFRKSDQQKGVAIRDLVMDGGILLFHRADLQQALLSNLAPTCRCHLSKRLVSYTESDTELQLQFQDGSTAACDLLIGADGLKSVVRRVLFGTLAKDSADQGTALDPIWTGTVAYRDLVPSSLLEQRSPGHRALSKPTIYCGKNKHLVVYPILQGRFINVVAFFSQPSMEGSVFEGPYVADATRDEVLSMYSGWEEEVKVLLACIRKPSRWAIQALNPLKIYARGRVALIGDAAHAMAPHQGAGAGQAIEDAYILATITSNAVRTQTAVSRTTEIYDTIRRPFGNRIIDASRSHGKLFEMNGPGFEEIQEGDSTVPSSKLWELVAMAAKGWEWAWTTSVEGDRKRALAML